MRRLGAIRLLFVQVIGVLAVSASIAQTDPNLVDTIETRLTHPEIQAKALELGNPVEAYKFVRNTIKYELYYGSKKGALGTLWSGSGNDYDQASLLIALLRAQGIPARYVIGVVPVDGEQLKQWTGFWNSGNGQAQVQRAMCWSTATYGPCSTTPKRFVIPPSGDGVLMEHAWVEAQVPGKYLGLDLEGPANNKQWLPLDPSWKQRRLPAGSPQYLSVPFDDDAYFSKLDSRLASEVWHEAATHWLNDNDPGKKPEDFIYDGPIVAYEGEVLPAGLPFVPNAGHPEYRVADIGELQAIDSVERRFRLEIQFLGQTLGDFSLPEIIDKRLTLQFHPTPDALPDVLSHGGYMGERWDGDSANIFEECMSNHPDPDTNACKTVAVLWVDDELHQSYVDPSTTPGPYGTLLHVGESDAGNLVLKRDVIPGLSTGEIPGGTFPEITYSVTYGVAVSIAMYANHIASAQLRSRLDGLLDQPLQIVEEGDEDLNGNGFDGESLVWVDSDPCTSADYIAPPDYELGDVLAGCSMSVAVRPDAERGLLHELLYISVMRYLQREHEETTRVLAMQGFSTDGPPTVGAVAAGAHFTYLFGQPVGVEPAAPFIDIKGFFSYAQPIGNSAAVSAIDAAIFANYTGSALEHQTLEELLGTEFVSTVKGIQLVRERFPVSGKLRIVTAANVDDQITSIENFRFDTIPQETLQSIRDKVASGLTITTPPALAVAHNAGVAVMIATSANSVAMLIESDGQVLGGAVPLASSSWYGLGGFYSQPSFANPILDIANRMVFMETNGLFGSIGTTSTMLSSTDFVRSIGSLHGDPVSMVSGNLYQTDEDLLIPTQGPPLRFSRTYNSQSEEAGELGFGWTHSYEMRVESARDLQEFVVLPEDRWWQANTWSLPAKGPTGDSIAARSDTLETASYGFIVESPPGLAPTGVTWFSGLPLPQQFRDLVQQDALTVEIAYLGDMQARMCSGTPNVPGSHVCEDWVDLPFADTSNGKIRFETISVSGLTLDQPWFVQISNFWEPELIYFVRVRLRYRGPPVDRVARQVDSIELLDSESEPIPGADTTVTDPLFDSDPATCLGNLGSSFRPRIKYTPSNLEGVFGEELVLSRRQGGIPGMSLVSATFSYNDPSTFSQPDAWGLYPNNDFVNGNQQSRIRRIHYVGKENAVAHVSGDRWCHLEYNVLAIRQQVDVLMEDGTRRRFERSGTGVTQRWVPSDGVRETLADLPGGGYALTRTNGDRFVFQQPMPAGGFRLSRIEDPRKNAVELVYDAAGELQAVRDQSNPSRALGFVRSAAPDRLTVSDWTGRAWVYTKDAQGDLVEYQDPESSANGLPGVAYTYSTGIADFPAGLDPSLVASTGLRALDHNLTRIDFPANGRSMSFRYDKDDRVASHTDALGNRMSFLFNVPRRESYATSERGFTNIYRHDDDGNLLERVDPDGAVWRWSFDEQRNVLEEMDPYGRPRTFSGYDARGNPHQVVDRDGRSMLFSYDTVSGQLASTIDKRGVLTATVFQKDGLPASIIADLEGSEVTLQKMKYGPHGELTRLIAYLGDGTGRVRDTRYFYGLDGRDLQRIEEWEDLWPGDDRGDELARTIRMRYDDLGRVAEQRISRLERPGEERSIDLVTKYEYDRLDRVRRQPRPDGSVLVRDYDANGNLKTEYLEELRPDGTVRVHQQTQYFYDAADRLERMVDALGNDTHYEYDESGNQTAIIDALGAITSMEYDEMGRPIRVVDANGAVTETEHDLLGQVVAVTDPTGLRTERSYDDVGRLVEIRTISMDGSLPDIVASRAIEYDAPPLTGYRERITDPNLNMTEFEFDTLGRVVRVTEPGASAPVTQFDFDFSGRITRVVDAENGETRIVRDTLGRVTSTKYPHTDAPIVTEYDEMNNPIRITDAGGCVLEQTYDVMGQLLRRRSTDACPGSVAPVDEEFGYDVRGNLTAARNPQVTLIREHDGLDRMRREIDSRFQTAVQYLYDAAGRLTTRIYPDGRLIQASYDPAGRPIGITDPTGDTTNYVYDSAGRRLQIRSRSGIHADLSYDSLGRLAKLTNYATSGAEISSYAYPAYDQAGNRKELKRNGSETTTYGYDELHRLRDEDPPADDPIRFEYDRVGNRTRFGPNLGGSWISYRDFVYDEAIETTHRLARVEDDGGATIESFIYDANGRPTTWTQGADVRTLQWDALGRLVGISGSFSASYVYDPFGRRIQRTEGGAPTVFYQHDGLDVVAEYQSVMLPTGLVATYVFGPGIDEPIRVERMGTYAAFHTDGLGSIREITEVSTAAATLRTYDYDAFGVDLGGSGSFGNAYTFTGRERDASSLYYYRARYYHAEIGRFLSPDPLGLGSGINAYAYVGSNPVNYRDPFGLYSVASPFSGGTSGYASYQSSLYSIASPMSGGPMGGYISYQSSVEFDAHRNSQPVGSLWGVIKQGARAQAGIGAGYHLKELKAGPLKLGGGVVFGSGGVGADSQGRFVWGNSTLDIQLSAGKFGGRAYFWDVDIGSRGVENIDFLGVERPTWDWSVGVGGTYTPYSFRIQYDFQPLIDYFRDE